MEIFLFLCKDSIISIVFNRAENNNDVKNGPGSFYKFLSIAKSREKKP
jgi:hypothetical protein